MKADRKPNVVTLKKSESRQLDNSKIPFLLAYRTRAERKAMGKSSFTFYRGSALAMAADLAGTPSTGIRVQLRARRTSHEATRV